MTNADKITKKLEQMNFKSTPAMRVRILSEASQAMEQTISASAHKPSVGRLIMKSNITKFAAAVIIIAALTVVYQFTGSIDGAGVAFGEVIKYLQTSSYTFDLTLEPVAQSLPQDMPPPINAQAMVIGPQKFRLNWNSDSDGDVSVIVDYDIKKHLQLIHSSKLGRIGPYSGGEKGDLSLLFNRPVERLWGLKDGSEESLGQKEFDGHIAVGFKVVQDDVEFIIWADSKSGLPLYVEALSGPNDFSISTKWTMNKFNFDIELDEKWFSLDGPGEYTIVDQSGTVVREGVVADGEKSINKAETHVESSPEFSIKPLEGVGSVKFGMTREQIVEILGEPDQVVGKHCLDYTSTIGLSLLVSSKRGLVAIDCWSQQENSDEGLIGGRDFLGKTDKGIGINSTRNEIVSLYGKEHEEYLHRHPDIFELNYPQLHTIFRLKNNKIIHISMAVSR